MKEAEVILWDKPIKEITKSQLTDIWNQANKRTPDSSRGGYMSRKALIGTTLATVGGVMAYHEAQKIMSVKNEAKQEAMIRKKIQEMKTQENFNDVEKWIEVIRDKQLKDKMVNLYRSKRINLIYERDQLNKSVE